LGPAKGPFIKDVRSQWREKGCPVRADVFQTRGILQTRTSALFCAQKTWGFSKFMVCPHGQGRVEPVRTRGEEINFSRFFADVFYGRPLTRSLALPNDEFPFVGIHCIQYIHVPLSKGVSRKISREVNEKRPKNSTIKPLPGGPTEK